MKGAIGSRGAMAVDRGMSKLTWQQIVDEIRKNKISAEHIKDIVAACWSTEKVIILYWYSRADFKFMGWGKKWKNALEYFSSDNWDCDACQRTVREIVEGLDEDKRINEGDD